MLTVIYSLQAMNDFRTALEREEGFTRAKEGIAKAQKLQKQAGKRDYYKILGVKRSSTKKEINKVNFQISCAQNNIIFIFSIGLQKTCYAMASG